MPRLSLKLAPLLLPFAAWWALAAPCCAQQGDFRIDSRVYMHGEEGLEEVSHTVTLFQGDTIYDFEVREEGQGEGEVAVLHLPTATFLLIDANRQVLTAFDAPGLEELTDALDMRALESESMLIRFLADPRFGETYNEQDQRLTLAAQTASYSVQGEEPADATLPARYAEFADWYAKANYTRPGGKPVTARLTLNRTLVEHGLIPRQVQFEFRLDSGERVRLQSTHDYTGQLSQADQEWITWARELAGTLEEVPPEVYYGVISQQAYQQRQQR